MRYKLVKHALSLVLIKMCIMNEIVLEADLIIKANQYHRQTIGLKLSIYPAVYYPQLKNIQHQLIRVIRVQASPQCKMLVNATNDAEHQSLQMFYLIDGANSNCSNHKKVQMAKHGLAKGVIIVQENNQNKERAFSGSKGFPIFFMDTDDGKDLSTSLSFIAELTVKDSFSGQNHQVEIWISSLSKQSYDMLQIWNETLANVTSLQEKIVWRPRFVYYSCRSTKISEADECAHSEYVSSCACGGQFCSPQRHEKSSQVLVREDIRQMLIFKSLQQRYLEYVVLFKKTCLESYLINKYAEDCAESVLNQMGIDPQDVSTKIDMFLQDCSSKGSFELYDQMHLDRAISSKLVTYPQFILNHESLVFTSKAELQNLICRKLSLEKDEGCIQINNQNTISATIISFLFFLIVIGSLIGVAAFVILCKRNKLRKEVKKEMKMQVETAVEYYFSMTEVRKEEKS